MTPQERAIRDHITNVLHAAREEAERHGHNVSGCSIGYFLNEIKLADDDGAWVWDVEHYRPFSPATMGAASRTVCAIGAIAQHNMAKETNGELRPSNQQVAKYLEEYRKLV